MKAIILAGGRGTRLVPYTTVLPKPLMPIGDVPILEVVLRRLEHAGFDELVLLVGHLAELIQAYCDCSRYAGKLSFVKEEAPLGTIGPIAYVDGIDDSFLVINGDIMTTLDFRHMRRVHEESGAVATVAVHRRVVPIDFGVVEADSTGRITGHREKPNLEVTVGMGICFFRPEVLGYIKKGEHLDFPDLLLRLLQDKKHVQCYTSDDYWLDIGRKDDYEKAIADFASLKDKLLPEKEITYEPA